MNVNEANDIAKRIESLISRTEMFGKSKNDILDELLDIANDYRAQADRLDAAMYADYINSLAFEQEKYEDRMIAAGV